MSVTTLPEFYAKAVEYCLDHPSRVLSLWGRGYNELANAHPVKALFNYCTPSGEADCDGNGNECGCLTQVKAGGYEAYSPELTNLIRDDDRLPSYIPNVYGLTRSQLEAVAEWQHRLDQELGRDTPQWPEGGIEEWERDHGITWTVIGTMKTN